MIIGPKVLDTIAANASDTTRLLESLPEIKIGSGCTHKRNTMMPIPMPYNVHVSFAKSTANEELILK